MIYYSDHNDKTKISSVIRLCGIGGVCACRILCLIDSYGAYDDLLNLWVQYDEENRPTAVAAKYGADMTLLLTDRADINEIREFTAAVGAASVTSEQPVFEESSSGMIMRLRDNTGYAADKKIFGGDTYVTFDPPLGSIHQLLKSCQSDHFICPSYEDFLLDTSHKLRHGRAVCCAVMKNGIPVAYAMTAAMTDDSAVIGAVCTWPAERHQGYGTLCVRSLITSLGCRDIMIMRAVGENEEFYKRLGFENCGRFYQGSGKTK